MFLFEQLFKLPFFLKVYLFHGIKFGNLLT
jgi:hypothetical protein